MHSIWSGSISFGLINIPVLVYSAAKERVFDFTMLHKKDIGPISFKRVCKKDNEEVPFDQIVKGFEYEEGKYVVLDEGDFKRAAAKASERIDIQEFVDSDDIDSKYYDKPYYLGPDKGGDKAYVLLREALDQAHKVGVAKMVFRAKEDLVILKPENHFLIVNQLRYDDEIRDASELAVPEKVDVSRQEVEMAVDLVAKLKGKFDAKKYHDTYAERLLKIMKEKAAGKELQPIPETPKPTEPVDLMRELRASLEHHRAAAV